MKLIVNKIEETIISFILKYIHNNSLDIIYKKLYEKYIITYLITKSKIDSNNFLCKYYLGIWYFQNCNLEEAQDIFEELFLTESFKTEAICFLTQIDLMNNEPKFTNSLMDKKYHDRVSQIQCMETYGNYYLTKKKYYQSLRIFNELLDLDNCNIEALVKIATIYERVDEIEKSLYYVRKVLEQESDNKNILLTLGRINIKNNDTREAIRNLSRYNRRYKNDGECLYELALLNKNMGKWRKSKKYFSKLLELNPNDWNSIYLMGEVLFEQKKYKKAFQYFTYSFESNIKKNIINDYLGLCKFYLGHYDEALMFFEENINSKATGLSSSQTYRFIGDVYEKLKKPKEKISYYKLAAKNSDEIAQEWLNKFEIEY